MLSRSRDLGFKAGNNAEDVQPKKMKSWMRLKMGARMAVVNEFQWE